MATTCAILAGVPLMAGSGIGSQIRTPLGFTIAGGLLLSQVLTLFTTPVVSICMDRLGVPVASLRGKGRASPKAAE